MAQLRKSFQKILVANRGEIAVRVMRALRELKITSVAIYSDADEKSLHRMKADEAYSLGDSSPKESYLNIPKIIAIAKKANVDAIHPGYGFLSENAKFAAACEKEGIVFIGPSSTVIQKMGDKIGAKQFLKANGIPVVPGVEKPLQSSIEAEKIAEEMGYPVLLKASAGGGGKGMRVVRKKEDLADSLAAAQREAQAAFADDRVFMEKYLEKPRHVECQVLADSYGKVIHLFERECSLQRRHQKVIEETPSVALDEALRERMTSTAVKIAEVIGYQNAGTIEFILDQQKNFYFLEVNTRLQVEHPVTEMVTGVDLVKIQIRVAMGEPLDVTPIQRGHAIECRVYAEDPENHFLPSIGRITKLREPAGEGIRVDSGIYEDWTIPLEYDPLLAKLIVHAPTRALAILKMVRALGDYEVEGVRTNIPFLIDLLRHETFREGQIDTSVIERYFKDWKPSPFLRDDPFSPWSLAVGAVPCDRPAQGNHGELPLRKRKDHVIERDLTSPMPGTVRKVLVKEGEKVVVGQPLMVLEAMKMEHSIESPRDGVVSRICYHVGDRVGMGEKLVEIS